jgi:hypothetical protein
MKHVCFQLFPRFPASDDLHDALALSFFDFWATYRYHARLISRLRPLDIAERLQELDDRRAHASSWSSRHLLDGRRFMQDVAGGALVLDHYIVCWVPPHEPLDALQAHISASFVADAVPAQLPTLPAAPRERPTLLAPSVPGEPYQAVMLAHSVRGKWSLHSWSKLFSLSFPLTLAIDIATLPRSGRGGINRAVPDAHTQLEAVLRNQRQIDSRTKHAYQAAEYANEVLGNQHIHQLAYAVLVEGRSPAELQRRIHDVDAAVGMRLETTVPASVQLELRKLFTIAPTQQIRATIPRRNTTSDRVAIKMPLAVLRQTSTRGPMLGIDAATGLPLHRPFDLEHKRNCSGVILGQVGSGKTTYMQTMAKRLAAEGTQIVLIEPANNARLLRDAIGDERACSYTEVSTTPAINLLDPVTTDPAEQRDKIIRGLEIALGRLVPDGARQRVIVRELNNIERGLIDRALRHDAIYGDGCQKLASLTPATSPRLSDLVAVLDDIGARHPTARELAEEIDSVLLGTSAHIYDRPTQLRLDTSADVLLYSFHGAAAGVLPIIYDHLLSLLNRYVRSPRQRGIVVMVDEVYYLASVPALLEWLALSTKTWRNFSGALWSCDQDAMTYLGKAGATGDWGSMVWGNAAMRAIFRLDSTGARVLEQTYKEQIPPAHLQRVQTLPDGAYLGMIDGQLHAMHFELSPLERKFFIPKETRYAKTASYAHA